MKDALAIHRTLLELEIVHEIVRLPSAIGHADDLPKVLDLPPTRCLVTRIFTCSGPGQGAGFLAGVIVPAGTAPSSERLSRLLGARKVRQAGYGEINSATEYAAELVCPLLLPSTMPLLIEAGLADPSADEVVYTATGEAATALGIRLRDLMVLSGARSVEMVRQAPRNLPLIGHTAV